VREDSRIEARDAVAKKKYEVKKRNRGGKWVVKKDVERRRKRIDF
jgi:hypothetical protein